MKFNLDCKCGGTNFELLRNGKLECQDCKQWLNPFSTEYHKVMKADGFHYFWVKMSPFFVERWERFLPKVSEEQLLTDCLAFEKKAVQNRVQATKYHGKNIFWKMRFNRKQRRLELELLALNPPSILTTKYHKKVEFVSVNL